jgi:hypothetical protein
MLVGASVAGVRIGVLVAIAPKPSFVLDSKLGSTWAYSKVRLSPEISQVILRLGTKRKAPWTSEHQPH